jgi:hypothetical protein
MPRTRVVLTATMFEKYSVCRTGFLSFLVVVLRSSKGKRGKEAEGPYSQPLSSDCYLRPVGDEAGCPESELIRFTS